MFCPQELATREHLLDCADLCVDQSIDPALLASARVTVGAAIARLSTTDYQPSRVSSGVVEHVSRLLRVSEPLNLSAPAPPLPSPTSAAAKPAPVKAPPRERRPQSTASGRPAIPMAGASPKSSTPKKRVPSSTVPAKLTLVTSRSAMLDDDVEETDQFGI